MSFIKSYKLKKSKKENKNLDSIDFLNKNERIYR